MNDWIEIIKDNSLTEAEFSAMLANYKTAQPMNFNLATEE
jgi:hypothetical protein